MDNNNITLVTALIAGGVSFLSPCVLPMLPTYTALLAGTGTKQVESSREKWRLLINAICFLSGFTMIFVVMGATASYLGEIFFDYQQTISKIGAIFMIIMGSHLVGFGELAILQREYRPFLGKTLGGPFGAFCLGVAFTAGWTPCIGPILASILVYASTTATLSEGALLLFVYAMGFCLPFLLMAILCSKYIYQVRKIYKWLPLVHRGAGIVLIVAGIIMYFGWTQRILGMIWN